MEMSAGENPQMDAAFDLMKMSQAEGRVEYLVVGDLVAIVPAEQADRWDRVIATSRAAEQILGETDETQ